jgi:hypothetical protein
MKTFAWLIGGFALLGLAGFLESMGDEGAAAGERLALYLPATLAMLGSTTCFYRALRSALSAIVGGGSPKPEKGAPSPAKPRPASRIFAASPEPEFDADAAFARYMEQREDDEPIAPRAAADPMRSAPSQPAFGRRVL